MSKARNDASTKTANTKVKPGTSQSEGYIDVDKIVGSEKVINTYHYAAILSRVLTRREVFVSDVTIIKILRNIMLMNVSIDPYHQAFELANFPHGGRRSMIPDDISGDSLEVVSEYARCITHPVIKARLAHTVWFLTPDSTEIGTIALDAYMDVLIGLEKGEFHTKGDSRSSNFTIVEYFYSTFRVLFSLNYPNKKNKKFTDILKVFAKNFLSQGDMFSFFRLVELMIFSSKINFQEVKNFLMKLTSCKNINISVYHRAYIWRLLAKASDADKYSNRSMECIEEAVSIYMGLFENCINSKRMTEALSWLRMAIYCYQDYGDSRYTELHTNMHRIEDYMLDELSLMYHSSTPLLDEFEIEIDLSTITLSEALYQFTIIANSSNPEELQEQAKEIFRLCPIFRRLNTPSFSEKGSKLIVCSDIEQEKNNKFGALVQYMENVRRMILVRDRIINYNQIIGYILRVSKYDLINVIQHSPVVHPRLVDTLSDGFDRYFKGDMISALYILVPLLEDIMRQALVVCGKDVTTYKNPLGIQEDRTISSLYDSKRNELESIFSCEIVSDIERVFLSEGGPCLRHGVAHANLDDGVQSDTDVMYAMWLIWRLIALPLIPRWSEFHSQS